MCVCVCECVCVCVGGCVMAVILETFGIFPLTASK